MSALNEKKQIKDAVMMQQDDDEDSENDAILSRRKWTTMRRGCN